MESSLPRDAEAGTRDHPRRTQADGVLSPILTVVNDKLERPPAGTPNIAPSNEAITGDQHRLLTSRAMAVSTSEATLAEMTPPTLDGRPSFSEHDEQMKLMQQQLVRALAEVQEVRLWQIKSTPLLTCAFAENGGARVSEKKPREFGSKS